MPAIGKRGVAEGFMSFLEKVGRAGVPHPTVASSPAPGRSAPPLLPETRTVVWWVG